VHALSHRPIGGERSSSGRECGAVLFPDVRDVPLDPYAPTVGQTPSERPMISFMISVVPP
jgi:hypothetical protein